MEQYNDFYNYVEVEFLQDDCQADKKDSSNEQMEQYKKQYAQQLKVRNDVNYKGVTEMSIKLLEDAEKKEKLKKDGNLVDIVSIKTGKRKTQADVDREIVAYFYNEQTSENFGMIWKRFYYGVLSFAHKLIPDIDSCNDCIQETFEKAWTKRDLYDPEKSNYSTWLYTICKNICMSKIQQNQKNRPIDTDVSDLFSSFNNSKFDAVYIDEVYYTSERDSEPLTCNTFDEISDKIYNASIYEIENNMDEEFKEIMYLRNLKNMKLKDIAEKLGMHESKVKNCYYKNKELLKEMLIEKYGDLCSIYQEALQVRDANNIFDI